MNISSFFKTLCSFNYFESSCPFNSCTMFISYKLHLIFLEWGKNIHKKLSTRDMKIIVFHDHRGRVQWLHGEGKWDNLFFFPYIYFFYIVSWKRYYFVLGLISNFSCVPSFYLFIKSF
jgi:hypothetical protein